MSEICRFYRTNRIMTGLYYLVFVAVFILYYGIHYHSFNAVTR